MNALWVRHDGPALVLAAAARLGLTATGPPSARGQWGQAPMSALDVAAVLTRLDEVYEPVVAGTLTGWLRGVTATAADGFDQRFGLVPAASGVAAKQGWMCCVGGRRYLHSAGVPADERVVVLLGDFPAAQPWAAAVAALDAAARAVLDGTAERP